MSASLASLGDQGTQRTLPVVRQREIVTMIRSVIPELTVVAPVGAKSEPHSNPTSSRARPPSGSASEGESAAGPTILT